MRCYLTETLKIIYGILIMDVIFLIFILEQEICCQDRF